MKRYQGSRHGHFVDVTVNGRPLKPRLDPWNHSPTGFEWGYGGSGPAQLALALLADHLEDELHQDFKRSVVAKLPRTAWSLSSQHIQEAIDALLNLHEHDGRATSENHFL